VKLRDVTNIARDIAVAKLTLPAGCFCGIRKELARPARISGQVTCGSKRCRSLTRDSQRRRRSGVLLDATQILFVSVARVCRHDSGIECLNNPPLQRVVEVGRQRHPGACLDVGEHRLRSDTDIMLQYFLCGHHDTNLRQSG